MKKITIYIILALALLTGFFSVPRPTLAQSCTGKSTDECNRLIAETEQKLSVVRDQKKTLASQIEFADTQIYLTTLRIQDVERKITQTADEVESLKGRIVTLNSSLDYISKLLLEKIIEGYKRREIPLFSIFIDPDNASTMINRLKYAKVVEENDRKLAFKVQQAKLNFEQQQNLREQKQEELNKLSASLEQQEAALENQKAQKQQLLRTTQNDEQTFQVLLAHLRADAASINTALGNVGVKIGSVNKGDVIAGVGSTGCSTGPHLHLEVYTDAKVENGRVIGNRVDPKSYLENGSYQQPVPGYPSNVTTWYGEVYFLGTHTGIDIAAPFNTPIRAMESGEAYTTSATCSYNGSLGKGIVIDHKNGIVTLYWHIP